MLRLSFSLGNFYTKQIFKQNFGYFCICLNFAFFNSNTISVMIKLIPNSVKPLNVT